MFRSQRSLSRSVMIMAALVVVLAGMRFASSFLSMVLLAVFFALLCHPIYQNLQRRGMRTGLAVALVALGMLTVVGSLALLIWWMVSGLLANLDTYSAQIGQRLSRLPLRVQLPGGASELIPSDALVQLLASIAGALFAGMTSLLYSMLLILFLLVEGSSMFARTREALGPDQPLMDRLTTFGPTMMRYFGLRTYLNALTGLGVGFTLWLLGIDYAPLWGILLFFLSYVPYLGIFIASIPPVILAFAEYGIGRAVVVIVGIAIVNLTLENVLMPRIVGKGLRISAIVVFLSVFIWSGVLGPAGTLLSMFLTILAALVLDSYDDSRWLAQMMGATVLPNEPGNISATPAEGDVEGVAHAG